MKLTIFIFLTMLTGTLLGQKKVEWVFSYDDEAGVIRIKADLAEGWHLYSQHIANDIGPVPTSFVFNTDKSYKLIGRVDEPKPIQQYDENFEALLDYFEGDVEFTQRISVRSEATLSGTVTYMACNATQCLPPVDEHFTITLNKE